MKEESEKLRISARQEQNESSLGVKGAERQEGKEGKEGRKGISTWLPKQTLQFTGNDLKRVSPDNLQEMI